MKLIVAAASLLLALPAVAQDKGYWKSVSTTARSITGDIAISDEKLTMNFYNFTIAPIRELQPAELATIFDAPADNPGGEGTLYRLNIPAKQTFLRKNQLCGAEDTTFMTTFRSGKTLQVAFFSGAKIPDFTFDNYRNATNHCGSFTYTK